eukprot:g8644.t1
MEQRCRRPLTREARNSRRRRIACLCTGVASLVLLLVAFVLQVVEGSWFPLLTTAAAFVLQVVCGTIVWRSSIQKTSPTYGHTQKVIKAAPTPEGGGICVGAGGGGGGGGGGGEAGGGRGAGWEGGDGSKLAAMEHGNSVTRRSARAPMDRRDHRSSRRIAAGGGDGGVVTDEDEESLDRHFSLETPLQQAARTLEFVLDKYSPDQRTQEKLEMVLNIISQPEDLNMVTIQSIMNADLDSSTTEWIEAQLSAGALGVKTPTGEMKWNRLREGLQGVVHRLASEFSEAKRDTSGTDTGMTSEQLKRQHEVGRAYNMEKAAAGRSRRQSANINVSQLMTLPGARAMGKGGGGTSILYEVDECSQDDDENGTDDEENAEHQALLELMPVWPGIAPDAQQAVVEHITTNHFLDWGFDVFKLQELSGGHALWYTGMLTMYHYNFVGVFNVNPANLSRFLIHVEHNYCYDPAAPNPYHTSVHAADVTLTVAHFCENSIISSGIKALQGFSLLVAAIVHDYRHRGVNNGYLIKVRDPLATTYNDGSVLENFHISEAFKVLYEERTNILDGLGVDEMRHFRQFIIKIILATDLAHGFEYVARFKASTTSKGGRRASIVPDMGREGPASPSAGGLGGAGGSTPKGGSGVKDPLQAQILLMQMVIKVADVAHPMKPWDLHERWTKLITEEFHRQGDLEAEKGVPVSPLCSREGHNQAKSQCDFVNFVVRPCATVFSEFCKDMVWVTTLESNYRR